MKNQKKNFSFNQSYLLEMLSRVMNYNKWKGEVIQQVKIKSKMAAFSNMADISDEYTLKT